MLRRRRARKACLWRCDGFGMGVDTKWNCDLALRDRPACVVARLLDVHVRYYIRDSLGVVGEGEGELPRACIIFIR